MIADVLATKALLNTGGQLSDKPNRRIQFSLVAILLLTGYAALQFAVCYGMPFYVANTVGTVCYLTCCSAILAMIVYGRGHLQAFAVGATIPLVLQAIQEIQYVHGLIAFLHPEGHSSLSGNARFALAQLLACLTGVTAVVVRVLVQSESHDAD